MKRVGHGGTLDPFATGLLVVAAGRATRVLQYVQDSDKQYVADIVLGIATDSGDIDGEIIERDERDDWPDLSDVQRVVSRFVGVIDQIPPAHSAIKVGGRKLYELARAGIAVDVPVRSIRIDAISIIAYEPPLLRVKIDCGKGTYVRSLARDIGVELGTVAYCHALRRTRSGAFDVQEARSLDELADRDLRENWHSVALSPDAALGKLPALMLSEVETESWYHGRSIRPIDSVILAGATVRIYSPAGRFVGVGQVEGDAVRPAMVIPPENG